MSWDDEYFMSQGLRVRHKYARSRSKTQTCVRCGCKRKHTSRGWLYKAHPHSWLATNPPCVKRFQIGAQ